MAEEAAEARRARDQSLLDLSREDLEPLSADDLETRIAALEAEIARARAQLARKRSIRAAADALFARREE